jgi:hypothetical protein
MTGTGQPPKPLFDPGDLRTMTAAADILPCTQRTSVPRLVRVAEDSFPEGACKLGTTNLSSQFVEL